MLHNLIALISLLVAYVGWWRLDEINVSLYFILLLALKESSQGRQRGLFSFQRLELFIYCIDRIERGTIANP